MINLLPNQEKKLMEERFYYRLGAIFFFAVALSFLVATISLSPAYFLSVVKRDTTVERLEVNSTEEKTPIEKATLNMVNELDAKLDLIEKSQTKTFLVSQNVISEIVLDKMSDIKLYSITYDSLANGGPSVTVKGIAKSRERLLLFRRTLEDNPAFKKVDLPISNFIRGSNIFFELNLIPS